MKKSALAAGLKAAAGRPVGRPVIAPQPKTKTVTITVPNTVLIGAHYAPQVRRAIKMVEAESGKCLKALLGEAINDLCVKYGKPEPYSGEDEY